MAEVYAGPVTSARSQRKSISGNNFQPVAEHERELEIPPLAEELDTERQRLNEELNDTLKKLARAQDSLEQETLSKTDLGNKLKTAIKDSQEHFDIHGQEMQSLQLLVQYQKFRLLDMESAFKGCREDLKKTQQDNKDLSKQNQKLEADLETLDRKYRLHLFTSAAQSSEAIKLQQQLMEKNRELININNEITTELRIYDNLLKEEEIRLGIQSPPQAETSSRKRPRHSDGDGIQPTPVSRSSRLKRGITRRSPFSQVLSFFQTSSAEKSLASGPIRSTENLPDKVLRHDKQNWSPMSDGSSWLTFFQTSSAEKSVAAKPFRSIENLPDKVLRLDKQNECPFRDGR